MKTMIQAAAVTLFAASAAHAQQAVQWRVQDGGNGHWYQMRSPGPITWPLAKIDAERLGGHLATPTTAAEKSFVTNLILAVPGFGESATYRWGPWLGGFQDRSARTFTEPSGAWRWVTGEPWEFSAWRIDEPNNLCSQTQEQEDFLSVSGNGVQSNGAWNDLPPNGCGNDPVVSYIIEWSADCNNDGIVDYGQGHDGTLADYNGNNIPDCCERGEACVVGNYPVQWRVSDGGNGHWYVLHPTTESWPALRMISEGLGGHLVTLNTIHEWSWVKQKFEIPFQTGRFVGGFQDRNATDFVEPGGGWRWITGEPFTFDNTYMAPFDDFCGNQQVMYFYGCCNQFLSDIQNGIEPGCDSYLRQAIFEWSADCNNDGIVDYGQILQGQLADANADGIPDICQAPTCVDADLFRDFNVDGADLGILLAQWGPNTPLTVSDINDDGIVDGADLGLLLSFWGVCP